MRCMPVILLAKEIRERCNVKGRFEWVARKINRRDMRQRIKNNFYTVPPYYIVS